MTGHISVRTSYIRLIPEVFKSAFSMYMKVCILNFYTHTKQTYLVKACRTDTIM